MELLGDFRIAVRGLLRSKGFAAASALTLALGIGATTTIFSVVYGVLLRPLPYRNADRLVVIQGEKDFSTGPRIMNYSPIELEEFAAATRVFSSIAMTNTSGLTYRSGDGVEPLSGATVSGTFFETIGVAAGLGRTFGDEVDPVVVISERFWRRAFAASPGVLGQTVRLPDRDNKEHAYTIVGVMPAGFQYPRPQTDVWRPLAFVRSTGDDNVRNRNRGGAEFLARLRDEVTLGDARADAARANQVLAPQFANSRLDLKARVTPLPELLAGTVGPALWMLMGAVGLVLLVACTNVANLILARQSARTREIAMRMAMGAPRARLVAYMMAESSVIAVVGCGLGIGLAMGSVRLLQYLKPALLPRLDAIAVDLPVMAFALVIAAVASVLAGFGPAILATRTDALLAMRAGSRGSVARASRHVRSALVVVEIAASIVLLVGAMLLAGTLSRMMASDLGVNRENVMTAQIDLALGRAVTPPRQLEMAEALKARAAAIPGVTAAGFGVGLPPTGEFFRMSFVLSNEANTETTSHIVTSVPSSPEYFPVLQIPLVRGRLFTDADHEKAPQVGILNREAARRFFGTEDAVGRTLPFGSSTITIVGVVENVKYTGIGTPTEGVVYRPFAQQPLRILVLVARTTGDPARIANDLRQAIRSYDPGISIGVIQPLRTWVTDSVAQPRFRAVMLSSIAAITLVLAMVGLYGLIAYSTSQRTSEIGVRIAIGAQRADVVRLVLAEGTRLAGTGIAVGMLGAYWATSVLSTFLYGVTARDLGAFAGSAAALFVVALIATYLPARRAARVDPMAALRAE